MATATITSVVMLIINCGLIPLVIAHGSDDDGGSSDSANLKAKGLILVKIWSLIIVFVGTFAGGISPYFFSWNETFLLLGTQFAAGVFLGIAWMHFLSDSEETFEDLTDKKYPFAFMLCTAGYLITMLADLITVWEYQKQERLSSIPSAIPVQVRASTRDTESGVPIHTGETTLPSTATDTGEATLLSTPTHTGETTPTHTGETTHNFQDLQAPYVGAAPIVEVTSLVKKASLAKKTSIGDSLLLVLALCFHSVFEGIAIGVAGTEHDAWRALWTVCLHKVFAAIAMGIALLPIIPGRPFLSCVAYALAFAISSPIGVGIGIVIDATTEGRVADFIYAISMGFACGVFVYVAINHLLLKGVIHNPRRGALPFDNPFYKYLAALAGAGVVAVVMYWD